MEKVYFTLEFECDSVEERERLFQELRERYGVARKREFASTIIGWDLKRFEHKDEA